MFQRQMYESALRDGLTKAFNKKYFTDRLESEFTFATRHVSPLALVLFDIDHFKKVNDTHGHQAGDHVLFELSTLLSERAARRGRLRALRRRGVRRHLPRLGPEPGAGVGERMRKAVEGHRVRLRGDADPGDDQRRHRRAFPTPAVKDANDIVGFADQALYKSKNAGRNRVTAVQARQVGRRRKAEVTRTMKKVAAPGEFFAGVATVRTSW